MIKVQCLSLVSVELSFIFHDILYLFSATEMSCLLVENIYVTHNVLYIETWCAFNYVACILEWSLVLHHLCE